jgi:hypothetical protein
VLGTNPKKQSWRRVVHFRAALFESERALPTRIASFTTPHSEGGAEEPAPPRRRQTTMQAASDVAYVALATFHTIEETLALKPAEQVPPFATRL